MRERLAPDLVIGQGATELLLDRLEPLAMALALVTPLAPARAEAATGPFAAPVRRPSGDVDVHRQLVHPDELPGDPAVEVDEAPLARDLAAAGAGLDVGREDAVGPGHRDQAA